VEEGVGATRTTTPPPPPPPLRTIQPLLDWERLRLREDLSSAFSEETADMVTVDVRERRWL